jgi:6-phosphofructokinase 1
MKQINKIGVFTSGGDSPGMNACVRAVVRTAHKHDVEVIGIKEGYRGMVAGYFETLTSLDVAGIIQRGGTILRSSRCPEFKTKEGRQQAYDNCKKHGIDALVAIGGNGTFTGALYFEEEFGIPTIGCPGTIDNDLFGTDYTIGFDTACNTVVKAIDQIRETAASHNRLFLVEVMGRDSGFIALNGCVAGGGEAVMLPEQHDDLPRLMQFLDEKSQHKIYSNIVVVAEGDEAGGAIELEKVIRKEYPQYDVRSTILGHLQRGGSPTCRDRILASRLGHHAVEALLKGKRNMMAGEINNKVELTLFRDSIEKTKALNTDLLQLSEILVA